MAGWDSSGHLEVDSGAVYSGSESEVSCWLGIGLQVGSAGESILECVGFGSSGA